MNSLFFIALFPLNLDRNLFNLDRKFFLVSGCHHPVGQWFCLAGRGEVKISRKREWVFPCQQDHMFPFWAGISTFGKKGCRAIIGPVP
jgi:hypothetical protein